MNKFNTSAALKQLTTNLANRGYSKAQTALIGVLAFNPTDAGALRDFHADPELVNDVMEMIADASITEGVLDDRAAFHIARSLAAAIQSSEPDYEITMATFDEDPDAERAKINAHIKAGFARTDARKETWAHERTAIVNSFHKLDRQAALKAANRADIDRQVELAEAYKAIDAELANRTQFITKYYKLRDMLMAA